MSVQYFSTTTYNLKTVPGVTLTLKKMSHGRRMTLNASASVIFKKIDDIQKQMEPIEENIKEAESAARIEPCICTHDKSAHDTDTGRCSAKGCECREPKPDSEIGGYEKRAELQVQIYEILLYELYPVYLRWGVSGIQGLSIDGSDATVESFIAEMPDAVVNEVGAEIQRLIKMTTDEAMGFKLPSTSDVPVDGPVKVTAPLNAPLVNGVSIINTDTAVAISPV